VSTVHASQQTEVQDHKRRRDAPVDIAHPEYLTADVMVRVGFVLVGVLNGGASVRGSVAGRHGEVGHGGREGDDGGDDMVDSALDGDVPGEEGERDGREDHQDENDP
jgi:hypothetical protein